MRTYPKIEVWNGTYYIRTSPTQTFLEDTILVDGVRVKGESLKGLRRSTIETRDDMKYRIVDETGKNIALFSRQDDAFVLVDNLSQVAIRDNWKVEEIK